MATCSVEHFTFVVILLLVAAVGFSKREQGPLGPRVMASSAKRGQLAVHVADIPPKYRASMSANELWALNAFGEPRTNTFENELWTSPGYPFLCALVRLHFCKKLEHF